MTELEGRPDLIKKRTQIIRITWLFWAAMFALVAVILGTLFFNAISAIATRDALLDCTTPSGECYQRGQEQTAKAVADLVKANRQDEVGTRRIVILAAACAEAIDDATALQIQRCVDEQLKEDE